MIVIKNGLIHDGLGNIIKGKDILIKEGKIAKIAENINEKVTTIIDADGKTIFPGFIESMSTWGIKGPGWDDNDSEENSKPVNPELNIIYSFDPVGMTYQQVFKYGVTSAGITPGTNNVIGGQMAVVKTYGINPYEMLVKEKIALVGSVSSKVRTFFKNKNIMPMTKMGIFALLKEAIKTGEKTDISEKSKEEQQVMQKVIKKELALFVNCNTKSEIAALKIALKDFDIKLVYTGAYQIQKNIISPNCQGIILGDITNSMTYGNKDVDINQINELIEIGTDIAIGSGGDNFGSGKESLLWNAILWHKKGLKEEQVLKMITSIPAKILGIDDKIGAIKVGLDADLSIWTDNPIKTFEAKLEKVFIQGQDILSLKDERGGVYW